MNFVYYLPFLVTLCENRFLHKEEIVDDRGSRVRFPVGAGNFSLHHRVQNGFGAHPASYPTVPGALSLGVKRSGREPDHSPPSSAQVKE
jgi:hypothetical protein